MEEYKAFDLVDDDLFLPGSRIKLDRTLYLNEYDISDLLDKSVEEVRELYNKSFKNEEKLYEALQEKLKAWVNDAVQTRRLQLALNYLEITPVEHTGNKWIEDKNGVRTISNSVYKMTCKITENTRWNLWSSSALNKRWHVEWQVVLNSPKPYQHIVIAGQERNYTDRYDAENYINGRIRAYSKYFRELSPSIPEQYKIAFTVSDHLLPGYRIEGQEPEQDKSSVISQLNKVKAQQKVSPATPSKKKTEPEI